MTAPTPTETRAAADTGRPGPGTRGADQGVGTSGEETSSAVLTPTATQRWRRWRFPLGMTAAVLLFAVLLTILQDQTSRGYLDPDGVNASGARALVRLLEDQGVTVTDVRTTDEAVNATTAGDTLLVTEPDRLLDQQIERLTAIGADIVLVGSSNVGPFAPDVSAAGSTPDEVVDPQCELPTAGRAGAVRLGGYQYHGPDGAALCYPAGGAATLVVLDADDAEHRLVLIGTGAPLTNRYLDQDGNAALATGLLGQNERLTWYRPSHETPPEDQRSMADLMPDWVVPALAQLAIAAVVAAWWRSRRLGPVVTEPLPVVVRAAEATEGRARLYRRGRARAHAAAMLRDAAVRRLRRRLGLPAGAPVSTVVDAVSTRSALSTDALTEILNGSAPTDDAGLVRLADSLDALEKEVHTS
ncbi:DUF4350 domain-containing protein [Phytoactinopolyspora halotolerans]|uniref:DUF4350 domain-containing protein n=1 Tax=Phytoactinopolyspora halotolerans TaxID=1981512 RepID=A0A6L9SB28_9ACTN|nr:DUF4350 domain-containing protein [Phytoactinopolyspora halotolerans]NEE02476.1 DUF4350 domain-containing protein [Phytoactinopolyspora halotolerans]